MIRFEPLLLNGVHYRPEISIPELHFQNPFQGYPTCQPTCHLASGTSPKPEKGSQNAVQECLFQVARALQGMGTKSDPSPNSEEIGLNCCFRALNPCSDQSHLAEKACHFFWLVFHVVKVSHVCL